MADDLNTEIKIGADASGVEAGVSRAKRSLKDLGDSAKKAGQDAGAGMASVGAGGDKAAKDVERATKNIQGQLQRAIASFDAGEKGSRKFYESLARQRGADVNTLKPLLDQLDAYKSKSEAAAQASAKVGTSFTGLSTAAGLAARAMAAIGITASVGEFVRMADASTNVASRLGLVTSSAAELANVQQRLFGIAQSSRVSFTDLVGTYAQVARSTKDLGVSQTALLGVIQTISQAVTISGGSAASAQAALVQLSQGFAAGALRGEELNSIMEQTPRLAQAIADGMGVSVGKLRELGQAGELTAEKVLGALEKSAASVAAEFGKMAVTVEQASTNAANSVLRLVGAFDRLLGVTSAVGGAIQTISNGLDFLSSDVEKLGNQGPLRDAAREVINLNAAAERLRTGMASGVLGPNAQGELDRINARLAEAKQRFRELDQQLSGGKDPRDQSGFTGRGVSYANEAARQAKLREDANAFRLNQAGVPASYLKDMAELIRLNQAGIIVGKEYTDALKKQQDELLKKTGAVKSSNAAANQEQNAYESLISSIRAKIEADKLEMAGGSALTESQRIRIKLDQDLAAGRVKLTAQNERAVRLALEELAASEASALAAKTLAKANLDAAASREKYLTSLSTGLDKIKADTAAQLEATARMGLSKEAIAELDAAKLEMLATDLELQAIKAMDRNLDEQTYNALKQQAEAYRDLAAAKKAGATKEMALDLEKANRDAAKKAADEWQKTSDKINDTLTDALMRGFESGKDFAKNMRDTVVNMFKTMVLRPVISAIVSPVAGAVTGMLGLSGPAQGGGNSVMGGIQTASNLNSLYGAGSQALFGGAAGASAASLGYANIVGMAGGDAIGALATANGMWAGVTTGAQAAAQAAIASNAAMAAGTAAALPAGTTAAAAGAGAGAGGASSALAAIPGWGWAAAGAAAVLGSVLGRKTEKRGQGIMGTLGEEGGVHDLDLMRRGGSLVSGPKWFVRDMGVSEMDKALQDVYKQQRDALMKMGEALGLETAGVENFTVRIGSDELGDKKVRGIRLDGLSDEEAQKKIAEALATANNEIAQQVIGSWQQTVETISRTISTGDNTEAGNGLVETQFDEVITTTSYTPSEFAKDGEKAIDTLTRLATSLITVNSAFELLGVAMLDASLASGDMASRLIEQSGGGEAFAANLGTYYDNFYDQAEKTAYVTGQVTAALASVGLQMPKTREEFRALVESQIALGDSGTQAVAALLGVSGAFATVADYYEQAAATQVNAAKQAAKAIEDLFNSALSRVSSNRFDLENQLLTQVGQGGLVQQRIDQRDLAELTKGLPEAEAAKVREQFEANLKLRDQYEANQLAADNLAKAMEEMERQQNAAAQAQRSMLQSTVASAQNAVSQLKSVFDTLDNAIASLRGSVASAAEQDSRAAREYIAQASVLMRSGSVVDAGRLQAAVRSATAGIDNQQFANSNEADFERLKLAGELAGLKDSTAGQLTVAEQHLSIAESQLAALEYIASSISSLGGAQQAAAGQPRDQWATVSGQQVYASSGGAVGLNNGSDIDIYGKDGSRFTGSEAIAFVRNQVAVNDEASVYAEATKTGISAKALDELMGWAAGTSNDWAKANKLPQFAIGTNYVPRDMVAQIHEGEAIVPKAFNPWANGSTGGDNTALIAELRALRAEVAELRNAAEVTAGATGATADVLVRVTNNGNGMVTAAAPI